MKNKMTLLISVGIVLALAVGYYFYVLYKVEVPKKYTAPRLTKEQINLINFATMDDRTVVRAAATTAPSHIVSVPAATFNKLTAYAFPHNITVSDTLVKAVDEWGTTQTQSVVWRPMDISSPNVQINLIRRVATNPDTYSIVRNLATSTPNTGAYTFTKLPGDNGINTYLEIGCTTPDTECKSLPITVIL